MYFKIKPPKPPRDFKVLWSSWIAWARIDASPDAFAVSRNNSKGWLGTTIPCGFKGVIFDICPGRDRFEKRIFFYFENISVP